MLVNRSMNLSGLMRLAVVLLGLILSACAGPQSSRDLMPPIKGYSDKLKLNYSLGEVALGFETQDPAVTAFYTEALRKSLDATEIFNEAAKDSLIFYIVANASDYPSFGLDMTVKTINRYEVFSSTGKKIVSQAVTSEGKSTVSEHFVGAARLEKASWRSVAQNIADFRDWFVNFALTNKERIDEAFRVNPLQNN